MNINFNFQIQLLISIKKTYLDMAIHEFILSFLIIYLLILIFKYILL